MEHITLDHHQHAATKKRFKASMMVLLLGSILSSQLEAEINTMQYQERYPQQMAKNAFTHVSYRKSVAALAEKQAMTSVIQGLPGLSNKQKSALIALYTSSQNKLNELRGSMLKLNEKQTTLSPGHHKYQGEMENIVALKASLAKEHKQLKSQFKRQLIQLLTPKQRQQLQSAVQKKHTAAKGIDKSWM